MPHSPPTSSAGLNRFARQVNSQYGEDGILAHLLDLLGASADRWCVEFGAWDGRHLSNTWQLLQERRYSAVLIEGDERKSRVLQETFTDRPEVVCLNRWVGFDGPDRLDALLAETAIPESFDVLSIDIDGNDYHVWEALRQYQPKIVVIEFNPSIPTAVDFVQARDPAVSHGCSLQAVYRLGQQKGYELVATTPVNAIFLRRDYAVRFELTGGTPEQLRVDESHVTYLFQGFDGSLFLRGCNQLMWHGVELHESEIQQLPPWLRKHPARLGRWSRRLLQWYRWRKRKAA